MSGYKYKRLGEEAWLATAVEPLPQKAGFYADNEVYCEMIMKKGIGLQVSAGEASIAVIMDTKQAKALRRALKMQLKAIKDEKQYAKHGRKTK